MVIFCFLDPSASCKIPPLPDSETLKFLFLEDDSDNVSGASIHTSSYESISDSKSDSQVWSSLTHDSNITGDDYDTSDYDVDGDESLSQHTPVSELTASQDQSPHEHYVEIPYNTSDEQAITDDISDNPDDNWQPEAYGYNISSDQCSRVSKSHQKSSKDISESGILDLCSPSSDDQIYTDPNIHNKNRKQSSPR